MFGTKNHLNQYMYIGYRTVANSILIKNEMW